MSRLPGNTFPDITLIQNEKYLGLCKAYNVGIREALKNNADYIVIANNDTKNYSVNYLEEVVKAFTKDDKIGLVGTKVFTYDGKTNWGGETHEKFCVPMNVPTCGYTIKREVFEKIGLFDEALFMNFEDLDFIIRLRKADYKTAFIPTVSYMHMGGGTKSRFGSSFNYHTILIYFWLCNSENIYPSTDLLKPKFFTIISNRVNKTIIHVF